MGGNESSVIMCAVFSKHILCNGVLHRLVCAIPVHDVCVCVCACVCALCSQ